MQLRKMGTRLVAARSRVPSNLLSQARIQWFVATILSVFAAERCHAVVTTRSGVPYRHRPRLRSYWISGSVADFALPRRGQSHLICNTTSYQGSEQTFESPGISHDRGSERARYERCSVAITARERAPRSGWTIFRRKSCHPNTERRGTCTRPVLKSAE
jgi:hypothetical protein